MILNFKFNKKTGKATWRFKAQDHELNLKNPQIVKCYEYLDKVFVIFLKNNNSFLHVYDAEANLYDEVQSCDTFFIGGIRNGIIDPEFVIYAKNADAKIYTYDVKKKSFKDTGEVIKKMKKKKSKAKNAT